MKLKLPEIASLAEIVGAFAVVVSLIYVGVQVNDSNRAVRSASINDSNVAVQEWYMQIGSDEQTSRLFYRSLMSDQVASNEEEFQFLMMFHGVFLAFQSSYLMAEEGTIDAELVDGLTGAILAVKETPGMQRYWRQRRTTLHPRFVRYVDELLEREGETPMEIYRTSEANEADE
ncbi:MAG: hypothetical protein OEW35_13890 [Gammaproteobacteria bacterium]|nr:hypothetical protein [Gammaproteobacteria bacterium]MDH4255949.1 hypothetical protein [Gammaproteobacteria bacterium]